MSACCLTITHCAVSCRQAIALCKAKGITTFVTAGSDEKCDLCAQRGASNVINYKTEDFAEVVNSRTQGVPCVRCSCLAGAAQASLQASPLKQRNGMLSRRRFDCL